MATSSSSSAQPAKDPASPLVQGSTSDNPLIIDTDERMSLLVRPAFLWQQRAPGRFSRPRVNASLDPNGGALERFIDLPLDLIFETAMYLHPRELLALSRLSKQLRGIFLSRSAASVWRESVRSSVPNLPRCPRDLTPPQYASFVFDINCMGCGYEGPNLRSYPTLRLRLCTGCGGLNLVSGQVLDRELRDVTDDDEELLQLFSILPSSDSLYVDFPEFSPLHIALSYYYFKPETDILIQQYISAKSKVQVDAFIAHWQSFRMRMTTEGKAIAPFINPRILGVHFSRRSCKVVPRPERKRRH